MWTYPIRNKLTFLCQCRSNVLLMWPCTSDVHCNELTFFVAMLSSSNSLMTLNLRYIGNERSFFVELCSSAPPHVTLTFRCIGNQLAFSWKCVARLLLMWPWPLGVLVMSWPSLWNGVAHVTLTFRCIINELTFFDARPLVMWPWPSETLVISWPSLWKCDDRSPLYDPDLQIYS
jgi:hypothetical protein